MCRSSARATRHAGPAPGAGSIGSTSHGADRRVRGFLLERGITFAAQPIHLRKNLPAVIGGADESLRPRLRWLLDRLWQESKQIETDVETITDEIERISDEDARCRQLRQIPASARWSPPPPWLRSAMALRFVAGATSRPGLGWCHGSTLPAASGTLGISERGNIYLRRMLIHGARSVLFRVRCGAGFGQSVHRLAQHAPRDQVVVAFTKSLARIASAVLSGVAGLAVSLCCSRSGLMADGKNATLGRRRRRFPLFPHHDDDED